ncbi:MAG: integrase [Oleiphilaceae bacterium]|jgi:integrase
MFLSFSLSDYLNTFFCGDSSDTDPTCFSKVNDELRRFSFHSLGHAVITEMAKSNDYRFFQRIVGHEVTNLGISKVYTGDFE